MELAFWFFDPPPIFRVLNSFFYIPWAHGTTRYMCQNGCFGGVFLVCQVMLTIAAATPRPALTPMVADLNGYCTSNAPPWFTWCSIQIVRPPGTDTMGLHSHLRDGAPMALIVCVGSFTGGDFWVESGCLLNPSMGEKKRHTRVCKGTAVEGWACTATPQAPALFNTRALHAPLPWEGERWSVTFYSAEGVLHCTPVWRQQLVSMGFRVPNASSNPSS